MSKSSKPRIAIYGIGQYGGYITRIADKKGWPIVAAYNRAGDKVGKDLGRLAGLDHDLGVVVQDCDSVSFENLQADIGVVTVGNTLAGNMPAYERFLSAGMNVICHGSEAYYPYGCDQTLAEKIDTLAKNNGVTFSGSGIWDMSRIWAGILAAGPCTDLESLFHASVTDVERFGAPAMQMLGIGLTINQFREKPAASEAVIRTYKTVPEHVLVALGYTTTEVSVHNEPIVFEASVYSKPLDREIPAGDVVGTRVIVEVNTEQGVSAKTHFETRICKPDEVEHMLWEVNGMPKSRVRTERDDSAYASASCLFNRIPDVIAAKPGIVLVSEMGPLKHRVLS